MDALSEVLRLARVNANVTIDATAHEPWCVSVSGSEAVMRAHLVVDGECELKTASQEATLRAGDFAFLPRGDAHLIGSALDAPAISFSSLVKSSIGGELPPVRVGGAGRATRWISFSLSCERHLARTLVDALPRMVVADLSGAPAIEWLTDALGLVLSSSDAPYLGASATRGKLAEIVFVEALARFIQSTPRGNGWLAGVNDRYVGRALALVHGRPGEAWTVEKLGRQVGLSRSALAERFVLVMGEPIFAFLTRWRLQLAAEDLVTTTRSIKAIAHTAGYESANAFSQAFQRAFGKPPSIWRRRRRK
jgi:AraC family transcriptional regulator, alkane utilization regulator